MADQYPYAGKILGRIINDQKYDFYLSSGRIQELIENNIKTINGNSLFGKGNVRINPILYQSNQSSQGFTNYIDHISTIHNVTAASRITTIVSCDKPGDIDKYISRILVDGVEIDLKCFARDSTSKTTMTYATYIGYPLSVGSHMVDIYYKDIDGNEIYSVDNILPSTLRGCDRLTNLFLPTELETIGDSAFKGCERINTVKIPKNVREIGEYAFADCTMLTNIDIPFTVETIGDRAFAGCKALTSIKLPGTLNNLGKAVFNNCTSLETIYIYDCSFNINIDLTGCPNVHNIYSEGLSCAVDVSSSTVGIDDWDFGVTLKNMTPTGSIKFSHATATALKESLNLTWCNVEWDDDTLVYKTSKDEDLNALAIAINGSTDGLATTKSMYTLADNI